MIDWLVNSIFRFTSLREAIFEEVHFYDAVDAALKEPSTNLTWCEEDGLWRGWTLKDNTYLFDDVGYTTMVELWTNGILRDEDEEMIQ